MWLGGRPEDQHQLQEEDCLQLGHPGHRGHQRQRGGPKEARGIVEGSWEAQQVSVLQLVHSLVLYSTYLDF